MQIPLAIVCLRCSCCSAALKRLLLLLPVALLAVVNGVLWRESGALVAESPQCSASRATTFFAGTTAIFTCAALAQLVSFWCASSSRNGALSSPPASPVGAATSAPPAPPATCCPARSTRRRKRLAVFSALLALSVASLSWAAVGCAWLTRAASSACAAPQRSVWTSVEVSVVVLFLLGWTLLTLTLCCRLEDVIVASDEVPSVDPTALSPKLCRSPRKPAAASEVLAIPEAEQQQIHSRASLATPATLV